MSEKDEKRARKVFIHRMEQKHPEMMKKSKENPMDEETMIWVTENVHFKWFKVQKEYFKKVKTEKFLWVFGIKVDLL